MSRAETPLKRIRRFCVERCMNGSKHEVRICWDQTCPLHDVRFGRNPNRTGIRPKSVTDAQLTARFAKRQPKYVQTLAGTPPTVTATTDAPTLSDDQLLSAIARRLNLTAR